MAIINRNVAYDADIASYKLNMGYASTTAFLTAKAEEGRQSATAAEGDVFYDTTDDVLKVYNGSAWVVQSPASLGAMGKRLVVGANSAPIWDSGKTVYEDFNATATATQLSAYQSDFTVFDGSTGVLNVLAAPNIQLHCIPLGAGQTIVPVMAAAGLNVAGDQTDNEGYELFSHWGLASGARPFVIGEDPAFYFKCKFEIQTINGCDVLAVGFRRAPHSPSSSAEDLVNADLNDYLDMAALGLTTAASPGAIKIQTIDDNAATTVTDTTDTIASATALTVKVLVSAAGVVTYQHDAATPGTLAAPTTTAAFTFDAGDPVVPFFHFLHANAAQAGSVIIHSWEAGYQ